VVGDAAAVMGTISWGSGQTTVGGGAASLTYVSYNKNKVIKSVSIEVQSMY